MGRISRSEAQSNVLEEVCQTAVHVVFGYATE